MHYTSLTPQDFVPPLLHMEIGMVNQVWDHLEQWIDNVVEMVPPHEQEARKKLKEVAEQLAIALSEREEKEKNNNIEKREKSAEVKLLKSELRKSKDDTERNELSTRIILLEALVTHLKNDYQISKEKVKEYQAELSLYKKKVVELKAERGKPEASIVAEI